MITPSRKIVQEIQPVQEEILTIVAKSDDNQRNVANGMGNFGMVIGGGSAAAAGTAAADKNDAANYDEEVTPKPERKPSGTRRGSGTKGTY